MYTSVTWGVGVVRAPAKREGWGVVMRLEGAVVWGGARGGRSGVERASGTAGECVILRVVCWNVPASHRAGGAEQGCWVGLPLLLCRVSCHSPEGLWPPFQVGSSNAGHDAGPSDFWRLSQVTW